METKHTPGPWWIDDDHNIAAGNGDCYKTIADPRCMSPENHEEMDANAHLIAAAPEMLELLKAINNAFYVSGTRKAMMEVMAQTKPLIHKATGQK